MNNGVRNRYLRMKGWIEFQHMGKELYKNPDNSDNRVFDVETALGLQLQAELKGCKEPTQ